MALRSVHETGEFLEMYERAAYDLCLGAAGSYGSLFNTLGPLRSSSDPRTGDRYTLERPRDFTDEDLREHRVDVPAWNLDYTTPVAIRRQGDRPAIIPVEDFVADLALSLRGEDDEPVSDHQIRALSLGISIEHESAWLRHEQARLAQRAVRFLEQRGKEVRDMPFKDFAADTVIREAKVNALKKQMVDAVRKAHNIASVFPGTANEMLRDRALRAITRPEREIGQFAMSTEEAASILFDVQEERVK